MKLDIKAPIIPYVGLGQIMLYSTMSDLKELLSREDAKKKMYDDEWIIFDIAGSAELFFFRKNMKLFRITTLDKYEGKLFKKIGVGTTQKEMISAEKSFVYYDAEDVWKSRKGVIIEMDPVTDKARWISVYVREFESDEFEKGEW